MSVKVINFSDNDDVTILEKGGPFTVLQYDRDLSCKPSEASMKYYMQLQGVTKKQVACKLNAGSVRLQKGAMQWMAGNVEMQADIKGAGDFIKKSFAGKVTGEAGVKPIYSGSGLVVTEPSYRFYLVEKLSDWNGALVISDGMFLASEESVNLSVVTVGGATAGLLGGEGFFNLCLQGDGYCVLESDVPREELITIELKDDVCKIDGPYAVAWSKSLKFTVERSGRSLVGSAASGEGLCNVYRGTGKILMMPQV